MHIARLPTELLIDIFQYCAPHGHKCENIPTLINITHVCHAWRLIGLQTPQLWTTITLPTKGFQAGYVEAALRRSRNAPLDVSFCYRSIAEMSPDGLITRRTLLEMHRIQHLSLTCPFWVDTPPKALLPSRDALCLETLSIIDSPFRRDKPSLLDALHTTSKLTTVHLAARPGIWQRLSTTSLKHLLVARTQLHDFVPPLISEVLSALRHLQTLETLDIWCSFRDLETSHEPVWLPHLRTLDICGDPKDCAALVPQLDLPRSAKITFRTKFDRDGPNPRYLATIFPALAGSSRADFLPLQTLSFDRIPGGVVVRGWTSTRSEDHDDAQARFTLPLDGMQEPYDALLHHWDFCASTVVVSHMSNLEDIRDIATAAAVRKLRRVEELYVKACPWTFLTLLLTPGESERVFPDLRTLHLEDMHLKTCHASVYSRSCGACIHVLLRALKSRADNGQKAPRLVTTRARMLTPQEKTLLAPFVSDIEQRDVGGLEDDGEESDCGFGDPDTSDDSDDDVPWNPSRSV